MLCLCHRLIRCTYTKTSPLDALYAPLGMLLATNLLCDRGDFRTVAQFDYRVIENVGGRRACCFLDACCFFLGCRTVFASCHVGVLVGPCFPIADADLGDSLVSAHGVG